MASGATGAAPGVCASAVTDSRIEFAAAVVTPVATRRRTKSRREIPLVNSWATRFLMASLSGLGARDSGLGTRDSGLGTRNFGTRNLLGCSRLRQEVGH